MAELKLPFIGHGGDYNPDQWRDRPDILAEDIRLIKLARCNLMSVGIFAWATLEHFQRTRGVLRLMAAVIHEWDMACLENNTSRYVFHFWYVGTGAKKLAVITAEEMSQHIPKDAESGKWNTVSIPFAAFSEKFSVWDTN